MKLFWIYSGGTAYVVRAEDGTQALALVGEKVPEETMRLKGNLIELSLEGPPDVIAEHF